MPLQVTIASASARRNSSAPDCLAQTSSGVTNPILSRRASTSGGTSSDMPVRSTALVKPWRIL